MTFEHVGHGFDLHSAITRVLESFISSVFLHLLLFIPDSDHDSFADLGDGSATLTARKLSETGFLVELVHHVFQVAHADSSFCWLAITASYSKSASELIDHDISSSAILLFERVLVLGESRPVRADSPGSSVLSIDGSMLADVNCKVLFFIWSVFVLNLVNISFPTRHVINYS